MRREYIAALGLGLFLVVACHHDDKACVEGASAACACADGASGAQVCKSSGAYGACECEAKREHRQREPAQDDHDPEKLHPLKIISSECREERAVVGLDKVRVVCSVENQNIRAYMVHVVGTFSTDNFAKRTGQTDVAIPPGKVGDGTIEFQNVDLGRSVHPRCECNVTSPDGVPITR